MDVRDTGAERCLSAHRMLRQTAKAFWTVLLTPKYILMNEVLEFISVRSCRPVPFAVKVQVR